MSITDVENLAAKADEVFKGLVIDKRRLPASQLQKRGVPAFVGEWLLDSIVPGRGPLTNDEADKVDKWASRFIPRPSDQGIIKDKLLRGETIKALTPVQVEIDLRKEARWARLRLLGIEEAHIPERVVEEYPNLLNQGLWGVVELVHTSDGEAITSFRPMQASFNLDRYKHARAQFDRTEWISLLMLSMGYNPEAFNESEQLLLLGRLLPLVQKNLHLMELAPKATGKSYLFENISPRVRLISGGNVTPAVLFVNNSSGQWGLLARYSVVVLDEIQTLKFEKPEEIVGSLKGFLANGRLTRGGLYETSSDCSFVMLANIGLDEHQKPLVRSHLVEHLPPFLQETAFLDRIGGMIPGWKIRKLSGDSFANSVGLKADFFGEALLALREDVVTDQYAARRVKLGGERPYTRNLNAVQAIASGMMKLIFPHGELSDSEFERFCVQPAEEYRQLIWQQLYHLDGEFRQWDFEIRCEIQ